ncbi:MAG: PSD1 and planctomycete cytochrome C domain-containing protein [Planctomycetota bacterium]|nr:PSD1 and planctomycete cytochrome C domain-containing protein [Planctomycetota bacterium]
MTFRSNTSQPVTGTGLVMSLLLAWTALPMTLADELEPAATFRQAEVDFFESSIRPLLVKHCYKCHSEKSNPLKGNFRLDDRQHLIAGGDSGSAVVPGEPDASLLWHALEYADEDLQMPPDGKLPDREREAIRTWIELGLPMPQSRDQGRAKGIAKRDHEQLHWSFLPLANTSLPPFRNDEWIRTGIDVYVSRKHRHERLRHSPPATRRELVRRLNFDLLGLPPSSEQVSAFQVDSSPDAWEQLVDRTLASPHYGERWGRYWLDLARYTDTTASWLVSTGKAHLYRDWVIKALNEDLPYDQFVTMQLAADKNPVADPEDMAALGFLGLSPTYWKEPRLAKEVIREIVAEEWEERIDAVGRTFLGLSIACARCHDHKFDPITTRDYYALAGVFASTRLVGRSLLPPEEALVVEKAHLQVGELEGQVARLKEEKKQDPEDQKKLASLNAEIKKLRETTPHYDRPLAQGVDDASLYILDDGPDRTRLDYRVGEPRNLPVFLRGNPATPGELVERRFLEVFAGEKAQPFQHGSGRGDLAKSLFSDSPALVARVIVNRVWMHHFGAGLVRTPSDFGHQGEDPSHPSLLDYLSRRFLEHGWSIKWLHREILLSATYQQSVTFNEANELRDPDNRYLWRMNRRRLDIESWRDTMLSVAGILDLRMAGPAEMLGGPGNRRRTVYGQVARRDLDAVLQMYGFPPPISHSPQREVNITPMQQLFVLNGQFIRQRATDLVRRLQPPGDEFSEEIVKRAFRLLYHRPAEEVEIEITREYFQQSQEDAGDEKYGRWHQLFQVLLAANELAFVD